MPGKAIRLSVLALVLALLGAGGPASDERADKIARFKKYMNDSNAEVRATTVPILEGIDDAECALLLVDALRDRAYNVRDEALRVLSGYRSEATVAAVEKALAAPGTGKARPFVAMALGHMRSTTSIPPLVAAASDSEWEMRRAVAEALGNFKDAAGIQALCALAKDSEPVVRTTAADSLGKVGNASVVEVVNALLSDTAWQVKAAACAAAGQLRDKRSILPLIALLKEEGRIKLDAKVALSRITGFQFGVEAKEWEDWWARSGSTFEVPPPEQPKIAGPKAGGKGPERRYAGPGTHYYGIATPSKNMIFLLDVSRSMADEVDKTAAVLNKTKYASNIKIEMAKEELTRTIKGLKENVKFNIILFETEITSWKKDLVPANEGTKTDAIAFVAKQKPRGVEVAHNNRGSSTAGLVGRTNIWDALQTAFGAAGIGTYDKSYSTTVDTMFLLTDGQATAGKLTKDEEILAEVRRLNGLRRVVLHTINLSKLQGPFLRKLAEENGGQFVDLVGGDGLLDQKQ